MYSNVMYCNTFKKKIFFPQLTRIRPAIITFTVNLNLKKITGHSLLLGGHKVQPPGGSDITVQYSNTCAQYDCTVYTVHILCNTVHILYNKKLSSFLNWLESDLQVKTTWGGHLQLGINSKTCHKWGNLQRLTNRY